MELKLYNSLTRKKEVFKPADDKRVTMYNCGPTVYSYAHIGNARAAVVADVLFRVLRHIYGEEHVIYSRNITDVDDKIIAAAKDQGVDISVITEKYAKIYNDDLAALNCLMPTVQPKATESIGGMIEIISNLMEDDYAYASDGHVFFDVSKFADYGKLSGNTMDALRKGDRVGEGEVARKKNSADFVLWKPELDGVGWDAPFGFGRPGWHIECSAMAKETLGETIDIHCGGIDLKFPHHENEIAQSECAHGKTMANYWVHNEFLNMGSEKMSKSLGNVKLVHDLLKDWDGEVIRLALLKAHYRSELIWTEALLEESKAQLDGWYEVLRKIGGLTDYAINSIGTNELQNRKIETVLVDDLNVPEAFPMLASTVKAANKALNSFLNSNVEDDYTTLQVFRHWLTTEASLLGLLQKDPEEWFKAGVTDELEALCKDYDSVRDQAVAAKEAGDKAKMGELFKQSDQIRDQIAEAGFIIETGPEGSELRRK